MTTTTSAQSRPLSLRLREDTKQAHTRAERSGIMRALLTGKLPRAQYVALLANLHPVYQALEAELEARRLDPQVRPFYHPALFRVAALEHDLVTLAGAGWAEAHPLLPVAREYAARIHAAAAESPALLVAHGYTRYLGDLSGGQILKRMVAPLLGPEGAAAVAFYDFPGIADPGRFKDEYRAALDALPLSPAAGDAVVAEALGAFELNARLFEALD